jgi:hypothetical protein
MEPRIRITLEGGCVVDVQSNMEGVNVLVWDMDADKVGKDPRTTLIAECPIEGDEEPQTGRDIYASLRDWESV